MFKLSLNFLLKYILLQETSPASLLIVEVQAYCSVFTQKRVLSYVHVKRTKTLYRAVLRLLIRAFKEINASEIFICINASAAKRYFVKFSISYLTAECNLRIPAGPY